MEKNVSGNHEAELKEIMATYKSFTKDLAIKFSQISSPFEASEFELAAMEGVWMVLRKRPEAVSKPPAFWRKVIKWAMNDFRKVDVVRPRRISKKFNEVLRGAELYAQDDYTSTDTYTGIDL